MRIKELREKAALTQEAVAKALVIDRSTVAKWEAGESSPRAERLPEFSRVLGCTIDELYRQPAVS